MTSVFSLVFQPFSWLDLYIPFQRQVGLSARVSWSNRWLLEQVWPFPISLSLSLPHSLSPHNNPTAVLMVTLSAKSEGLDFYRTHELSTVGLPAVDTLLPLSLSFPTAPFCLYWMFHFFLFAPFVCFISPHLSTAHLSPLLVESTVPSLPSPSFVSSSRNPNHDWALSVSVYKSKLQSNLLHLLCYCSSFLCFTVSSNDLPLLYHVLQTVLIVLSQDWWLQLWMWSLTLKE